MMDWRQLVSPERVPKSGGNPAKAEAFRTPFEADCDRIVYSAPFRRLGGKTQVHPFAQNDHVHNRLTHSIEVANVGRGFGRRLATHLARKHRKLKVNSEDLCQILQAACLAHDIGNPPFGHAGEFAIREWARTHGGTLFLGIGRPVEPGVRADWEIFEGNAQGFRLAARADNPKNGYMRLTYAALGTMIKYPWDSLDGRARAKEKYNVFSSESDLFREMSRTLGTARTDGTVARHPMSFLCEAADDICYRVMDLEDAVSMRILDERKVLAVFKPLLTKKELHLGLHVQRGIFISRLMDDCWRVFDDNYDQIMSGARSSELKEDMKAVGRNALEKAKHLTETIFAHRTKVATELGAYEGLGRIISTLCDAARELAVARRWRDTDFLTQRRLELAWGRRYAEQNQTKSYEWWLHQVMDFVAGLTDQYARRVSTEMAGL